MSNSEQNGGGVQSAFNKWQAEAQKLREQAEAAERAGNTGTAAEYRQHARGAALSALDALQVDLTDAIQLWRTGKGGAAIDSTLALIPGAANYARAELAGSNPLFTRPHSSEVVDEITAADEVIPLPYPIEATDTQGARGLGIPQGAITVIAGATGHGKTTLLIDMAARIAGGGRKVLYLTNEQTRGAIYKRIANRRNFGIQAAVDSGNIIVNECGEYDSRRLLSAIGAGLRKSDNERPAVLIIDWLQMIGGESGNGAEWYRLRDLMAGINAVALDTGTAIITAAQFNRSVVNPARVGLGAMGDSVGISQMAAKVIGIWNANKAAQWGARGAFDAEGNTGKEAPGFSDMLVGGYAGLYMRVLKERHGRRLYPATLMLDAGRAQVGAESGAALIPVADEVSEDVMGGAGPGYKGKVRA